LNFKKNNLSIKSGGQTGVERAALDYALCNGLLYSGWCPHGRRADDGIIPRRYVLQEAFSEDLIARVAQNIIESDGVLIIIYNEMDEPTQLAYDLALDYQKPVFVWAIYKNHNHRLVANWIEKEKISVLNITGPSEKNAAGIHEETLDLLDNFFGN
jgi:hypothetical protein